MLRKETFKMKRKRKYLTVMDLLKKADYNAKITEIESKIPSITWLATTAALTTAVENKIPDVINLVKKQTNIAGSINNTDLDFKKQQH